MKRVTVHEAKTHLSALLRDVVEGEEVIIARGSTPIARIVPIERAGNARRAGGAPPQAKLLTLLARAIGARTIPRARH